MSNFSKKHYEVIAREIKKTKVYLEGFEASNSAFEGIAILQARLVTIFMKDNPNFDLAKFAKACHPDAR